MTEYTGRVAANVIWVGNRLLMAKRVSDGTWSLSAGKKRQQIYPEIIKNLVSSQ